MEERKLALRGWERIEEVWGRLKGKYGRNEVGQSRGQNKKKRGRMEDIKDGGRAEIGGRLRRGFEGGSKEER